MIRGLFRLIKAIINFFMFLLVYNLCAKNRASL